MNATLGVSAGPYAVLCECGDPECTEHVTVPGDVYDVVRADTQHFLVAPGHELPEEQIIAQETSYRVVQFAYLATGVNVFGTTGRPAISDEHAGQAGAF